MVQSNHFLELLLEPGTQLTFWSLARSSLTMVAVGSTNAQLLARNWLFLLAKQVAKLKAAKDADSEIDTLANKQSL